MNTAATAKSADGAYEIPTSPAIVSRPFLQSERTIITTAVRSQSSA